jgi:hypothetical protein
VTPYVGSVLKMETAGPSETLVPVYQTKSRHTLEDQASVDRTGSWLLVRMKEWGEVGVSDV